MILQLVLIQVCTFVLIVLFLRWLLYSHISRALRRLQRLNQENLEKEKALKEEFERAKRETEREIEDGRKQSDSIKEEARALAEKDREQIVDKARQESNRLIQEAHRECQRKQAELTIETQEKAVYLACDMIKYIFTEQGKDDLQSHIIDELIDEIEKVDDKKIKAIGDVAEVACAFNLKDEQKSKLKEVLTKKLQRNIEIKEKLDKDIIAGLNIKIGGFVIDGSIRNRMKKILPMLKEKAKE